MPTRVYFHQLKATRKFVNEFKAMEGQMRSTLKAAGLPADLEEEYWILDDLITLRVTIFARDHRDTFSATSFLFDGEWKMKDEKKN